MSIISIRPDVVVIGSGIAGVTTASQLRQSGLAVLVIDASRAAAEQTSAANAGELSFGYSGPWATPGLLQSVPFMLMDPEGPLRIHLDSSLSGLWKQSKWLRWFGMNTRQNAFEQNKERIINLSQYSHQVLQESFNYFPDQWAYQSKGTLQLFRERKSFDKVLRNDLPTLRQSGVNVTVATEADCIRQEPGLAHVSDKIVGGLIFHDDSTGDCAKYTRMLAGLEQSAGVNFMYNTTVTSIDVDKFGVRGVQTTRGAIVCNRVVVCGGYWTAALLQRSCGLSVPIYPVRGYSLTIEVDAYAASVRSTILDERTKVALTNLGPGVLRVAGTAEICNPVRAADPKRYDLLAKVTQALFPQVISSVTPRNYWIGHRPMTPDGTPVIGSTPVPGLFLNSGHGTLGWTQSFGSAKLIADVLLSKTPALDASQYELMRYGRRILNRRDYYKFTGTPSKAIT